jgi:DNA-binding beta-propeller fold protein YncE
VNNSDRILVADRATFKLKHTIPLRKPRFIQRLSEHEALVSSLYSRTLFKLSLKNYTVIDSVVLPRKNPEGVAVKNGLAYVCPWDVAANHIYVVADGKSLVDSIQVGAAPQSIELDAAGGAWVLSGNAFEGVQSKLTRINLDTRTVEKTYTFPPNADPVRLAFNGTRDTLYYIGVNYTGTENNGVFRMAIGAAELPTTPFIPAVARQYYWAVGVDPRTGRVYVGDPKGFTQKGAVRQYSPQGTLLKEFSVGVGPGQFYFD